LFLSLIEFLLITVYSPQLHVCLCSGIATPFEQF